MSEVRKPRAAAEKEATRNSFVKGGVEAKEEVSLERRSDEAKSLLSALRSFIERDESSKSSLKSLSE